MALDGVVFALALHLLALALLTFTMRHFLLALTLKDLAFPGVPFVLAIQRLGRRMLHGLADAREGMARVTGAMGLAGWVLAICWGLVRSPVALVQFCQAGEGVATRLATGMIRTCGRSALWLVHWFHNICFALLRAHHHGRRERC